MEAAKSVVQQGHWWYVNLWNQIAPLGTETPMNCVSRRGCLMACVALLGYLAGAQNRQGSSANGLDNSCERGSLAWCRGLGEQLVRSPYAQVRCYECWRAVAASCVVCGVLGAVPANAEPPGSPATAEDTQRSFSLLSKGFVLGDCDAVDLVGGQRAAISASSTGSQNGPYSATYALCGDAKALQSWFFTAIGQDDQLVACPGTNQSPTVYRHRNSAGQMAGQSEVVWTSDADLLLGAARSLDDVAPLHQWWPVDG
jgi:hypothetical protein